jgi:hypothetical protein
MYGNVRWGQHGVPCGAVLLDSAFSSAGWSRKWDPDHAWAGVYHIWSKPANKHMFANAGGAIVASAGGKMAFLSALENWVKRCGAVPSFYPETLRLITYYGTTKTSGSYWCDRLHRMHDGTSAPWVVKDSYLDGGNGLKFTTFGALLSVADQACATCDGHCCCQSPTLVARALESAKLAAHEHGSLIAQKVLEPPMLLRGSRVSSRDFVMHVHWVTREGVSLEMSWLLPGFLLRAAHHDTLAANINSHHMHSAGSDDEWSNLRFRWSELPKLLGNVKVGRMAASRERAVRYAMLAHLSGLEHYAFRSRWALYGVDCVRLRDRTRAALPHDALHV